MTTNNKNVIRIARSMDSRLLILLVTICMLIIHHAFRCTGTVCVFLCRHCLSTRYPGIDCLLLWLLWTGGWLLFLEGWGGKGEDVGEGGGGVEAQFLFWLLVLIQSLFIQSIWDGDFAVERGTTTRGTIFVLIIGFDIVLMVQISCWKFTPHFWWLRPFCLAGIWVMFMMLVTFFGG